MQELEKSYFCPDMKSQADATDVEIKLANEPGVLNVEVDLAHHEVRVRLADTDSAKKVGEWLASAGYPAED